MNQQAISDAKNIADQIILITGGTSGVGKATALALAGLGAKVVLISRSEKRATKTLAEIAAQTGNDNGAFLLADLSMASDVRSVATQFKQKFDHLDVLANCAGAILPKKEITTEGIERSFAINYLSHFGLTTNLLDILKAGGHSRIITVAGSPFLLKKAHLDFENLQMLQHFSVIKATMNALYARLIFTAELSRRLDGCPVTANAFHPGLIKSNLTKSAPWYIKFVDMLSKPFQHSACDITTYLCSSQEVRGVSGQLFSPDKNKQSLTAVISETNSRDLWEASEALFQQAD